MMSIGNSTKKRQNSTFIKAGEAPENTGRTSLFSFPKPKSGEERKSVWPAESVEESKDVILGAGSIAAIPGVAIKPVPASGSVTLEKMLDGVISQVNTMREQTAGALTKINQTVADLSPAGVVMPYTPAKLSGAAPASTQAPKLAVTEAVSGQAAGSVIFSPFIIRLWSKKGSSVASVSGIAGGVSDTTLLVGRYIFTFKAPVNAELPFISMDKVNIPISVDGKKVVIEKVRLGNFKEGDQYRELKIQVNILENPIPVLVLIAAAAAGIGLGGWGLADMLDSVDKVVLDTA